MSKSLLYLFSFLLLSQLIYAQSTEELMNKARSLRFSNPDSAELMLKQVLKKLDPKKDIYSLSRTINMYGTVKYARGNVKESDSLYKVALHLAKRDKNDSVQVFIYSNLGQLYYSYGTIKEAEVYYKKALELAQKKNFPLLAADSYNNLGTLYMQYGLNETAIDYFEKGLDMYRAEKNDRVESEIGVADISNNMADSYFAEGKYDMAYQYFFAALKTFEKYKLWDKAIISSNNIAEIYFEKSNYKKADEYASLSLHYLEKKPNVYSRANLYFALGKIKEATKKYDSSEYYFKSCISLFESINHTSAMGSAYNSLGSLYAEQFKFPMAKLFYEKSFEINKNGGDTSGMCVNYTNMANLAFKQNNIEQSEKYNQQGLAILKPEMNFSVYTDLLGQAAEIAAKKKQFERAYRYVQLFNVYRDSIRDERSGKQQEEIEAIYQNQKKQEQLQLATAENQKKTLELQTSEETSKRKSAQLYAALIGALLLIVLAGFVIRSNIQRKKTNRLLQEKNVLISRQKEEVEEQRKELAIKNDEIEQKNKEILDSINYAQRIQYALLAQDHVLKENLPEHFVMFKPKDIVSGDFYWATKKDDKFYFAVCDSTGHGVPGAFMSLLNISYLNEAVSENVMTEPGKVFDHVRNKLIANVSHGTERQDGMDGILLCMESNASGKYVKLKYAAAYNVPLLIRNNEVIALKADKMPVGKGEKTEPFNSYEVELQSGDILYIYTDGYADQFGGPKGKKFKYKQLEELLISVNHLPMNEQSELLRETIEKWRGELEQVDDVLIAGIKF